MPGAPPAAFAICQMRSTQSERRTGHLHCIEAKQAACAMDERRSARYPRRMIESAPSGPGLPEPAALPEGVPAADLPQITQWLRQAASGDRAALDAVYASLYPDLKRIARSRLRQQGRADSLSTTMLVHESFVRLVGARGLRLEDRRHFFAYAAKTMRHIIIDSAREHLAERRGGGAEHTTLGGDDALQVAAAASGDDLVRVNEALKELEAVDPELAELVEMRYFGGYSEVEIAELQGVTERTVRRRWDKARAWLFVALGSA